MRARSSRTVRNESIIVAAAALAASVACQADPDGGAAEGGGTSNGGGTAGAGFAAGSGGGSGTGFGSGGSGTTTGGSGGSTSGGSPSSGGEAGAGGSPCAGIECGGVCIDPMSNPEHCGRCGNACAASAVCSAGQCTANCVQGLLQCGQACVAPDSDDHCGACGNRCNDGETCRSRMCVPTGSGNGGSGGGGGGASGGAGSSGGGGPVSACGGRVTLNPTPFGCELAWGANGNNGNRSSYLDFITAWVGYEANGGLNGACDGCNLARQLANTSARAVYYAYFIGYGAREDGYGDCNTDNNQNLCTHGAAWIRNNRQLLLDRYANYARMTHMASPDKGVVWLLEGDFIQYTYDDQTQALSMAELGTLAGDIVCAIKSNQPTAAVALNHSTWIRNPQMSSYFGAMPMNIIDMVWTTGMGNVAGGYFNDGDARNRSDGTYTYLSTLTGKKMLVDTSFGVTSMNDSWTGIPLETLNLRIDEGVAAVNVTEPPSDYQTRVQNLRPQLGSVCD